MDPELGLGAALFLAVCFGILAERWMSRREREEERRRIAIERASHEASLRGTHGSKTDVRA